MKLCLNCGKELPATIDYFFAQNDTVDGLKRYCKKCQAKIDKHAGYKAFMAKRLAMKQVAKENRAGAPCGSSGQNKACSKVEHISIETYINKRWVKTDKWGGNPDFKWRFWFGKYKHKPVFWVAIVNPNYVHWCLENVDDFKRKYNKFRNENDNRLKRALKAQIKNKDIK